MSSSESYLLDTNACIALINGTPKEVRRRFQRAVNKDATMLVSSVVAFELWYGVAKSERKEANTQRLEAFLAGPLEWTPFGEEDAQEAGRVRAELEMAGNGFSTSCHSSLSRWISSEADAAERPRVL